MVKILIDEEMKDCILKELDKNEWTKKAIDYTEDGIYYLYCSQEDFDNQKVKKGKFVSFSGCATIDDAIKVLENLKSQGYKKLIPNYCSLDREGDFAYKLVNEYKQEYTNRVSAKIKDAIYTVKEK